MDNSSPDLSDEGVRNKAKPSACIIIHAPGIHSGGGLTLLRGILDANPSVIRYAQLDSRAPIHDAKQNHFRIFPTVLARLQAERRLAYMSQNSDNLLYFHGLPPIFKLRGTVTLFVQNRLLIDGSPLARYPLRMRMRLMGERLWFRYFYRNVDACIVQSESMKELLAKMMGKDLRVRVLPFLPVQPADIKDRKLDSHTTYDFSYVASGESHKNHENLLAAWKILAREGLFPSLALTVDSTAYPKLATFIDDVANTDTLSVKNLGWLDQEQVSQLYRVSSALIYPSYLESMGLPLIEASMHGLPILASERDFVRDFLDPEETFDPNSPISIARAVRRFLKRPNGNRSVVTPREFIESILL
jgi:glycosyltransferase involved in cell wall biosynthesis